MNDRIVVETDLFDHREVKPYFINPCCFGEDFAGWLRREFISHFPESGLELSEPIQEDYGWGFWASKGKDRFWIAISYVGDGPQEAPAQWIISVSSEPKLFSKSPLHKGSRGELEEVRDHIKQTIASNSAIKMLNGGNVTS